MGGNAEVDNSKPTSAAGSSYTPQTGPRIWTNTSNTIPGEKDPPALVPNGIDGKYKFLTNGVPRYNDLVGIGKASREELREIIAELKHFIDRYPQKRMLGNTRYKGDKTGLVPNGSSAQNAIYDQAHDLYWRLTEGGGVLSDLAHTAVEKNNLFWRYLASRVFGSASDRATYDQRRNEQKEAQRTVANTYRDIARPEAVPEQAQLYNSVIQALEKFVQLGVQMGRLENSRRSTGDIQGEMARIDRESKAVAQEFSSILTKQYTASLLASMRAYAKTAWPKDYQRLLSMLGAA